MVRYEAGKVGLYEFNLQRLLTILYYPKYIAAVKVCLIHSNYRVLCGMNSTVCSTSVTCINRSTICIDVCINSTICIVRW